MLEEYILGRVTRAIGRSRINIEAINKPSNLYSNSITLEDLEEYTLPVAIDKSSNLYSNSIILKDLEVLETLKVRRASLEARSRVRIRGR